MKTFQFFLPVLFVVLFTSCNNDDDCSNKTIARESLEGLYGCTNTEYQIDIDLSEDFTVISSQQEFDTKISGSCTPDIDFNTVDLIIGKKTLSNGFSLVEYQIEENCETGNLEMTVDIMLNATTMAPNITYHALVPKLEADQAVEVTINAE